MERMKKAGVHPRGRMLYHVESRAAWAEFEDLLLDARQSLSAVFTHFDFNAPVQTHRARQVGADWAALIAHALGRNVKVTIRVDDRSAFGGASEVAATLATEEARIRDLIPHHSGRISGPELVLIPLAHPARRDRNFGTLSQFPVGHGLNFAVIDDTVLFLTHRGLHADCIGTTHRGLSVVAQGPVVGEAITLLDTLSDITSGKMAPPPARRLLRTLSGPGHGARGLIAARSLANEVDTAHQMMIHRSERSIYIETQGFDSLTLARHLAARAKTARDLEMVLILPLRNQPDPIEQRCIALLRNAFGTRLFVGTAPHGVTNVSIFDSATAIAGSSDLRRRALQYDSHAALYLRHTNSVADLQRRLVSHWFAAAQPGDAPFPKVTDWHAAEFKNAPSSAGDTTARARLTPYP